MVAKSGAVWAIDIGNNSLKALHLTAAGGTAEVIGFEDIEHDKILAGSGVKDAERDELVALSLRRLLEKHDISNDEVIISVPSQNSFARFVNLPPVDSNRIPEIVRFEAAQQIPFDFNDVQWDWQLMSAADSPERKVGIFAIKNEVADAALKHFGRQNINVRYVQMSPMALYNYLLYDRPGLFKADNQGTVVLNIGAENTDLVVCSKSAVWQRSIPMGGNAFTRAIAEAFKLNFEKAEKLKRTAPMSKYARQILQAMKPVFTDLSSEIQRSLGFYSTSNPNTKLSRVIALGGGTKMRGLLKYLQQTLQIPVERPDSFKRLAIGSGVSAAKFHESVSDFGVVYGLALQGLGLARMRNNLLPAGIARSMAWAAKAKYFTAAASVFLLVSLLCFARTNVDRVNYKNQDRVRREIASVVSDARQASRKVKDLKRQASAYKKQEERAFQPFEYRDVIPRLQRTIISTLPDRKNNPEQAQLYDAFENNDVEKILEIPRKQRKQVFITNMLVRYAEDITTAEFGQADFRAGGARKREKTTSLEMLQQMMPGYGPIGGPQFGIPGRGRTGKGQKEEEEEEARSGFVVSLAGYSPYENLGELMDPAGVENDPNLWGIITRLTHLDEVVDGNCPFELYKKTDVDHFELKIEEVSLDAELPLGIGVNDVRHGDADGSRDADVLIDPMTREIISRVAQLDSKGRRKIDRSGKVVYEVNDHWFTLDMKFVWKDAPEKPEDAEDFR